MKNIMEIKETLHVPLTTSVLMLQRVNTSVLWEHLVAEKTTLLNCISTIDSATAGHIYLEGEDLTTLKSSQLERFRREKLGFIFQDFNLLDTLTGFENIALALTI